MWTYDDDEREPSIDNSLEDFHPALARGYGFKDGNQPSVLPAQHIVSIRCQISTVSSKSK